MDFDQILDALVADCEMRSELDRRRTFLKCVEYADEHVDAEQYNDFLLLAAERLGQGKLMREALSLAVRATGRERLHLRFDETEGVQLIGNPAGLLYLSRVLKNLSQAQSAGEHITLGYGEPPLMGESYPLAAYVEDDGYFDELPDLLPTDGGILEQMLTEREITPDRLAAFIIHEFAPEECGITADRLYPVLGWEKFIPGMLVWRKELRADLSRVVILRFRNDDGAAGRMALDLDDPDIDFITTDDLQRMNDART